MTDRAQYKDTAWNHAEMPAPAPFVGDHTTDVCVIGAGIAGLTTAYLLAKAGRSVMVLDDGAIGGGETGLTTAHLTSALDRRWAELAKLHSLKSLKLAAESHTKAIARIEQIARDEEIDCSFRRLDGYLFKAPGDSDATIREEIKVACQVGLEDVAEVGRAPLTGFDTGVAARFPDQAQFQVRRYLAGLARAISAMGGHIRTLAHVVEVDEKKVEGEVLVTTDRRATVRAKNVVVATNASILADDTTHLKQLGYRTYAIAMEVRKSSVTPALYWDTADPFHYVRVANLDGADGPEELLIVGGEDHKTGAATDADERHGRLEAWARERFPTAGAVKHRWSGEVMETVDGLAYIGRVDPKSRIFVTTGDCGNGITHGTIAGILITDLVCGRENPWEELYNPGRVNLHPGAALAFMKQALDTAASYATWLTSGDVANLDDLAPGAGAVIRRGLTKLAVYRDPAGVLHECSAVCPHMGAIVAWNAAEKTWDCPAHASRFDCDGKVLHGPATGDLKPVDAVPASSERRSSSDEAEPARRASSGGS